MKSAAAIAFELRPSRLLAGALVGVALLALLAIGLSGLRHWPWIAVAVGLVVAATLLRTLGVCAGRAGAAPAGMRTASGPCSTARRSPSVRTCWAGAASA